MPSPPSKKPKKNVANRFSASGDPSVDIFFYNNSIGLEGESVPLVVDDETYMALLDNPHRDFYPYTKWEIMQMCPTYVPEMAKIQHEGRNELVPTGGWIRKTEHILTKRHGEAGRCIKESNDKLLPPSIYHFLYPFKPLESDVSREYWRAFTRELRREEMYGVYEEVFKIVRKASFGVLPVTRKGLKLKRLLAMAEQLGVDVQPVLDKTTPLKRDSGDTNIYF